MWPCDISVVDKCKLFTGITKIQHRFSQQTDSLSNLLFGAVFLLFPWHKVGDALDGCQHITGHHRTHANTPIHTLENLERPISLQHMTLVLGGGNQSAWRKPLKQGENPGQRQEWKSQHQRCEALSHIVPHQKYSSK